MTKIQHPAFALAALAGALAAAPLADAGGPVWAWGSNDYFESTVPPVAGVCKQVAAGGEHTVILRMDNSVACFGRQTEGQCAGLPNLGACSSVAAGGWHTVVIRSTGAVAAWGYNQYGQSSVPATVGACSQVAAGDYHTLALRTSGTVAGWGLNNYGQSSVPATVGIAKWIAAGGYHSLAVRQNGTAVAWGPSGSSPDNDGQCTVPASLGTCTQVAAGRYHSVALRTDGAVTCWGNNDAAQCSTPVGLAPCINVSAGAYHTVALQQNGTVVCWGLNGDNQSTVPLSLPGCTQVSAGGTHTAVLTSNIAKATNLQATDGTQTIKVALTWTAAAGATDYQVFRSAGNTLGELVGTSQGATTYNDLSAVAGTLYTYWIKTVSASGVSAASASDTGWRNVSAPTSVLATDGTSTANVVISWAAVPNAAGYRVYRAVGTGTPTELGAPAASPFTDATASPGVLYTYTVRARTAAGNSAASVADTGWRKPTTPTGVAATDGTLTAGVRITWTGVTGATRYGILRKLGPAAAVQIATSTASPYTDATAVAGTVYAYSVVAIAPAGNSAVSATDTGWRNSAPVAPIGIQASDGTFANKVQVTWTASTNVAVTGYRVVRRLPGGAATPIALVPATTTSYADTGIAVGVVGSYTVQSQSDAGFSAFGLWDDGYRASSAAILAGPPPSAGGAARASDAGDSGPAGNAGARASGTADRAPATPTGSASSVERAEEPAAEGHAASDPADCETAVDRIRRRIDLLEGAADDDASRHDEAQRLRALLPAIEGHDGLEACPACRMLAGDVNLDGEVDGADLAAFLAAWERGDAVTADLDRDGRIDRADLNAVLQGWGAPAR